MGKFLFATLGSLGDLHPCMGVARELQRRGHSITIGTSPFYSEYIRQAGFGFAPVEPDLSPTDPELLKILFHPRRGAEFLMKKFIFPYVRKTTLGLVEEAQQSDVIVSSVLFYGAPVLAKIANKPWASGLLSPMAMFSGYEPPILAAVPELGTMEWLPPSLHSAMLKVLLKIGDWWAKDLHKLRKEYGLPKENSFFSSSYSPHLTLCLWSDHFGAPQPDWPASAKTCGFVYYDPKDHLPLSPELEAFLAAGNAPIIFTLGSTMVEDADHFFHLFERTIPLTKYRAIVTVGARNLPRFRERSSDRVLYIDYAPYEKLFSRGALIVHQGGVGTSAQAIRSGRPSLVLPYVMDQLDNALRIEKRKLGLRLPLKRATPKKLAAHIERALSDREILETCRKTGELVQAENGPKMAAELLEALLPGLPGDRHKQG